MVRHLVQEVPVVGHRYERVSYPAQKALQPRQSVEVQVVGRLIQDQEVGVRKQRPGERGSSSLPAADRVRRRVQGIEWQPDSADHPLHAALVVVPTESFVLLEGRGVTALSLTALASLQSLDVEGGRSHLVFGTAQSLEGGHDLIA